jgi:hypothetical protein
MILSNIYHNLIIGKNCRCREQVKKYKKLINLKKQNSNQNEITKHENSECIIINDEEKDDQRNITVQLSKDDIEPIIFVNRCCDTIIKTCKSISIYDWEFIIQQVRLFL